MVEHLFVYGTLRRSPDGSLHPLLSGRSTFVGEARCAGQLYDLGPYPAALPSGADGDIIHGEVYALHGTERVLARLDVYEGHAYRREIIDVTLSDGGVRRAWIYFYDAPLNSAVRIPGGDYRMHQL